MVTKTARTTKFIQSSQIQNASKNQKRLQKQQQKPQLQSNHQHHSIYKMPINKVVILRHGESEFNKLNLFCGWHDAPLTEKGNNLN